MTVWILVVLLTIGGEVHQLQEIHETQESCEERGEMIWRSHIEFFHDDLNVPDIKVECWQVERESI